MRIKHSSGFTLVELSMVLIIIGLLAAGITTGLSLVNSAKIQSVISSIHERIKEIKTFETKYKSLPGDMIDATSCFSGVLNGNGDSAVTFQEGIRGWKHLESSGIGNYGGMLGSGSWAAFKDTATPSIPKTALSTIGINMVYLNLYYDNDATHNFYSNTLNLGDQWGAANNSKPGLTVKQAFTIDKKIDDGRGRTGKVFGNGWGTCYDGTTFSYVISTPDSVVCYLSVLFGNKIQRN